jgi:hypothetical protein
MLVRLVVCRVSMTISILAFKGQKSVPRNGAKKRSLKTTRKWAKQRHWFELFRVGSWIAFMRQCLAIYSQLFCSISIFQMLLCV